MKNLAILPLVLAALASPALAQDAPQLFPAYGAPGDPVLLKGEGFSDDPAVEFDGTAADVLRSDDRRILVRVPDGLSEGTVTVTVDGTAAEPDFLVLPEGAPVILHLSATTVTPGQHVFLIGRRLRGATADFVDGSGDVAATVGLTGGRAAVLQVPEDLAPGTYTLVVTNDAASTGDSSPEVTVVEAGAPTLETIEPEDQLPGRSVRLLGTDLGPIGPALVVWTREGEELRFPGLSNGYDRIHSRVPFQAEAGATYDVHVELRGGGSTEDQGLVSYTLGTPPPPSITGLDPAEGPPGSVFRVTGENLFVPGERPVVEMSDGTATVEAKVLFGRPGFGPHDDALAAMVPEDLADGEYGVTVTVGGQTSDPATFTVGALPLTVDSMRPDHQGVRGPLFPVHIEGTGFGFPGGEDLSVTWTDQATGDVLEGHVILRFDRLLVVIPPGGRRDPLPAGTYDVDVTVGGETAAAGTYTVGS